MGNPINMVNLSRDSELFLTKETFQKWSSEDYEHKLPEQHFLEDLTDVDFEKGPVKLESLLWVGVGSNRLWEEFAGLVSELQGTGKIQVVWESGDVQVYRIEDGHLFVEKSEF